MAKQRAGAARRALLLVVLGVGGVASVSLAPGLALEPLHPLTLIASLLPLQLAGLLWVFGR
jgi:hypothetical protein